MVLLICLFRIENLNPFVVIVDYSFIRTCLKNMMLLCMSGSKSVTAWLVVSAALEQDSRQIGIWFESGVRYFFIYALESPFETYHY